MKLVLTTLFGLLILRLVLFLALVPRLHNGQQLSFTTTLSTDPTESIKYNRLTANYGNIWGTDKIFVTYSPDLKLAAGDVINISGRVEDQVINKNHSILSMYFPVIKPNINQKNFLFLPVKYLLSVSRSIRQNIASTYSNALSKEQAGLLLGIVLGTKAIFTKQFQTYLQSAGVLHVIAASGMNVTMVAGFLFSLASGLVRRKTAIITCIFGVLFYMLLAGMQPSIVRAGLMGILAFSAQFLGRQYSGIYSLFLVGGLMLLWDPNLFIDPGFRLSFMATLGILTIRPVLPRHPAFDDLGTTLSAQIATLPILLGTFGTLGITSVLVNFLLLWTIPPLMILGSFAAIAGMVFAPLGTFFCFLCQPFLWYFISIVQFFGSLGWNITLGALPWGMIVGYYAMVGEAVYFLHLWRSRSGRNNPSPSR